MKIYPLIVILAFSAGMTSYAQQKLTGRVTDESGEILPGVNIVSQKANIFSVTDHLGEFQVQVDQFPVALTFSFVGMTTAEVKLEQHPGQPIDVVLKNSNHLNELVVVGYGQQRRSDITGSVASVPLELRNQPVASAEKLLQGTIPGVVVTQTSGQPGGGVSVQIRGNNSINAGSDPLYVIDGFPINNDYGVNDAGVTNGPKINPLSTINTDDIESIEVLKDASATAIYGSRGANGVVIITTKTGSKNKSSISYDTYYGRQEVVRTIPLLNAAEWWQLRKDAAANSGRPISYPGTIGYSLDTIGEGTDWQNAAFRRATILNHNLTFQGGTDKTRIALSGNYFKQDGILQNSGFRRISARLNLEHELKPRLTLRSSLHASNSRAKVAPDNIVQNLLLTPPSLPIYQDDGSFVVVSPFESSLANPINSLYNQVNNTQTNRFLGSVSLDYTLLEGLKFRVLVGADIVDNKQNRYLPKSTYEGLANEGVASVGTLFTSNWLNENTLTYAREFGKSRFNIVGGFTAQQSKTEGVIASSAGFASDAFKYNNLGLGIINQTPSSLEDSWSLASWLGRFNYSYDDRYLFTATLRADGSSKFGSGNKWGYFPSAAVGWNLSNEPFFYERFKTINQFKLRFSVGSTGNQSIPSYTSLSRLGYFRYNFSNTTVSGYAPVTIPNTALSWEKTLQLDFGADIGLLNNRISVTADYYYKLTTDLLLDRIVPGTSGLAPLTGGQIASIYQNIGAVSNEGVELYVNTRNLVNRLKWNTIVIFGRNTNKILSLGDDVDQIIPQISQPSILKVGYPVGSFIVYQTDGIIQVGDNALTPQQNKNPGGQKYKDINGDGKITQADDRIVVTNQPGVNFGLTNTFSYQGFDLTVFLQGTYGAKLYNMNRAQLELGTGYTNGSKILLDRWTPENTNTDVKAAFLDPAITISDRFIEDASYVRLKNLTVGYHVPRLVLSKLGLTNLRFYMQFQNVFTWTRYTGFDPEVSRNEQSLIFRGIDNSVYPNAKSWQTGLNLTF